MYPPFGLRSRARAAGLCAVIALAATVTVPGPAAASPASEVRQALTRLVTQTGQLPSSAAEQRRVLLDLARAANKQRGRPCNAFTLMKRYRAQLARLKRTHPPAGRSKPSGRRVRPVSTRGLLDAAAIAVDAALLSHPNARPCGGAKTAPAGDQPRVTLLESNERGLTMRVMLPQAHFAFRRFGNRDWTELVMEGMRPQEGVGMPGLPSIVQQFGIPTGADVSARVFNVSSYTLQGVSLLPQQEEPVDQAPADDRPPEETFFDARFAIDSRAYRSRSAFPASLGGATPLGEMRDIRAGGAKTMGGQYRAREKRLRVITSVDVRIDFGGDNRGTFGDARLNDHFNATFQRLYDSAFVNWDTIRDRPGSLIPNPVFCGEEVLIITSSTLRPAANTLRSQKEAEGYLTSIREMGAGAGQIGTTHTDVQSYIRSRVNSDCWLRPSYVILIGDTSHVPTWIVPCSPGGMLADCNDGAGIASDLPHALKDDTDVLADVALGRIPANTLDQANTVVGKIVGYETTAPAPAGDDFYRHFTTTAYFEPTYICELNEGESGTPNCDGDNPPVTGHWVFHPEITQDVRGFTITAERVRNEMLAKGYTADRLYYANPANDPQTYHDGTPMPAAIKKPGFPWDADTNDFVDAFNDGRSIVFHRDHGWPHGWAHPDLSTGNVPSLTNGTQLPVVFGVNCASARFDVPGDSSMVESLLQSSVGGAVGGFGDSRNSGTWANNSISIGFFDAMFPDLVASYGAASPLLRMGDVLLAGKQYLVTAHAGAVYGHGMLYGYFGDPTMQSWVAPPVVFDPSKFKIEIKRDTPPVPRPPGPGPTSFYVLVEVSQELTEGTLVTLVGPRGDTVGRGKVQNGRAVVFPNAQPSSTAGMKVQLQNEGFFAGEAPVQGQ